MKEYCIYNIWNGGTPFIIHTFNTFEDAYCKLLEIIQLEIERNRIFYVDNDFYNNKYLPNLKNCKYFCIKEREITEWKKFEKFKSKKEFSNNIYFLNDFIDKRGEL